MDNSQMMMLPQEYSLRLIINEKKEIQLICTAEALEELTVGFLYNEGLIQSTADIVSLRIQKEAGLIQVQVKREPSLSCAGVRVSGLGGMLLGNQPTLPYRAVERVYSRSELQNCAARTEACAEKYRQTGGMHCTALFEANDLLVAYEDVGRHNTLDKIAGHCLLHEIAPTDALIITSGRISSEMAAKAARIGAAVIASYTTPTQKAYEIAKAANLTLVGYVKREQMRIYCGEERIIG